MDLNAYSIPAESRRLLLDGLINNPLHSTAPSGIKEAAECTEYTGSALPHVPINWRFAESIAAIKGFQGAMLNVLLNRKYDIPHQNISINT